MVIWETDFKLTPALESTRMEDKTLPLWEYFKTQSALYDFYSFRNIVAGCNF